MQTFIGYLKNRRLLVFLFLLFFFTRIVSLDQLNLLHDERDIVLSGYSIAKTGYDLYHNAFPLSFNHINPDNPLFAIYYSALWWVFIPVKSIFLARLPFVFISTFLIFLVYEFVYYITKNNRLSYLTTIVFCFSPWVFHLSRLAMDITLAIVFVLAGMLLYVKNRIYYAFLLFFLAFYTYEGFRVLIPFLVFYLALYFYIRDKNTRELIRKSVINVLFLVLLFSSIFLIDAKVTQNRFNQVVFLNLGKFTEEVNFRRNTSIAPDTVKKIIHNKVTVTVDYILTNFVKNQDVNYLFKEGDGSPINGNAVGGQFLLMLLIFYYLGIMYLGNRLKKEYFYIVGFAIIGMSPALASLVSTSFSIRAMLSCIGYSFILALGIYWVWKLSANLHSNKKSLILAVILIPFILSVSYFMYNFYFRRPILVSEVFNEKERQLSQYLIKSSEPITVYDKTINDGYLSYIFLRNKPYIIPYPDITNKSDLHVDGITFVNCEKFKPFVPSKNSVVSESCLTQKQYKKLILSTGSPDRIYFHDFSGRVAYFIVK